MTREELLAKVACGEMNVVEASAILGAASAAPMAGRLSCKVSAKGGVSVYGLGRWPLTLYVEQWERLLAFAEQIKAFLKAQNGTLKRKLAKV